MRPRGSSKHDEAVEASAVAPPLLTAPPLTCVLEPSLLEELSTVASAVSTLKASHSSSGDGAEQHRAYMNSLLPDVQPLSSASPSATLALAALAFEMLASSSPELDAGLALAVIGRRLEMQTCESEGSSPSSGSGSTASPHPAAVLEELVHSGLLLRGPGSCLALAHRALLQPLAECELSRVFGFAPQAALDQHFLCSLPKVRLLLGAAAIAPQHTVCELGAGIGSLARHLPPCAQLTLVDLDPALARALRHSLGNSAATVLQADALAVLRSSAWDIVVSSLPHFLTQGVLGILAGKARGEPGAGGGFVRAVLSVHAQDVWQGQPYTDALCISDLCVLHSKDFFPAQPFDSKAILVTPRGVGQGQ